jgi:hypothetical protein
MALAGSLLQPVNRCFMVPGDTGAGTIQGGKPVLGGGIAVHGQGFEEVNGRGVIPCTQGSTYGIHFISNDYRTRKEG